MKSIVLERQFKNFGDALVMLDKAVTKFPQFDKLWMIKAQIHDLQGDMTCAREALTKGVRLPNWTLRLSPHPHALTRPTPSHRH